MTIRTSKISARKATFAEGYNAAIPNNAAFAMKPSAPVTVVIPDPTAEELAAQAEQSRKWRIDAANRWLDDRIASITRDLAKFTARLQTDPANAFEWADEAIQASAVYAVARTLRAIFDEHGYDAAVKAATREAMRGARWPAHSTSAVSNFTKECITAAYAAFVADFAPRA